MCVCVCVNVRLITHQGAKCKDSRLGNYTVHVHVQYVCIVVWCTMLFLCNAFFSQNKGLCERPFA